MSPEEVELQRRMWNQFLTDFEAVYPIFETRGIDKNVALQVFACYGGSAPVECIEDEEGEEWRGKK